MCSRVCLQCPNCNSVVGIQPESSDLPYRRQYFGLAVGAPKDALGFWCRKLNERGHMDDICRWEDNIKMDVKE